MQEDYESDIEAVPNNRAQEIITAYSDLDFTHATEVQPNWAPTPVKVVGPELEPCELYFHEFSQLDTQHTDPKVKKEPHSVTSTPRKKVQLPVEEEIYPLHTPKVQS